MITITQTFEVKEIDALKHLGNFDKLLFFDIETTGFSGDYSNLYLIGCTYYKDLKWHLIQWFADTLDAEVEVLHSFFTFMKSFDRLVHFNGEGFDIPYLLKRCTHFQLAYDFTQIESFDIYKKIRPYKKCLNLTSLKLKAIEAFLSISREDLYHGGQLIEVYKDYLYTKDEGLKDLLLLHNADDLKGMPLILPILNYTTFFHQPLLIVNHQLCREETPVLEIHCQSNLTLPRPFVYEQDFLSLQVVENQVLFKVNLYQGELKYFYPDYKNYYYLPYEDQAIHKSVAEYVDKNARVKATAKTCYTKKVGLFLPYFSMEGSNHFLKEDLKSTTSYQELPSGFLNQEQALESYVNHLFTSLTP